MTRRAVETSAVHPRGPYSSAIITSGPLLFVASQAPVDHATGQLVSGSFADEARQALSNLDAVVAAAGGTLSSAVKVTVFLRDMADLAALNEVYEGFFPIPRPARTVAQSSLDFGVAIDAVVSLD